MANNLKSALSKRQGPKGSNPGFRNRGPLSDRMNRANLKVYEGNGNAMRRNKETPKLRIVKSEQNESKVEQKVRTLRLGSKALKSVSVLKKAAENVWKKIKQLLGI